MKNKKFNVKFYQKDGTLIDTVDPSILASAPTFSGAINAGLGQCTLKFNLPFDDFASHVDFIDHMTFCEIFEVDEDNLGGRLIFTGYTPRFNPRLSGDEDFVQVILLGLGSLLSDSIFGTSPNYTEDYSSTGADPATIATDIIDNINTQLGHAWINYSTSGGDQTVFTVGTSVKYIFDKLSHGDALNELVKLTGGDWFWHVDGQGYFWFKEKPSTATHTFQIGLDVLDLDIDSSVEDLKNRVVLFWDDPTPTVDTDSASITAYGERAIIIEDSQIKDSTSATQRVASELAKRKDPKFQTTMIVTSEYDIESIRCGDTCEILGLKEGSDVMGDNMQIVAIKYNIDKMTLQLDEVRSFSDSVVNAK